MNLVDGALSMAWALVVTELTHSAASRLRQIVDLAAPPPLFDFALEQWYHRNEPGNQGWDILFDSDVILMVVALPELLSLPQARTLFDCALLSDPLFDTRLLRRLISQKRWPDRVQEPEIMRTLELIEGQPDNRRLSIPLLKLSKHRNVRVQSKVAKLLGGCMESIDVIEGLFANPDGRVRANLIEGIGRRDSLDGLYPLIERAASDQNSRVSSMALALRARAGHSGSGALIRIRSKSKTGIVRRSAEVAERLAAGLPARPDTAGALISLSSVVDAKTAVAASVEEVHRQAQGHPDE